MEFRHARSNDIELLASLNHRLIQDEGSSNRASIEELQDRMRNWLETEYKAILFEQQGILVGYALYRPTEDGIHLRQFFIAGDKRRLGLGRAAVSLLCERVFPRETPVTVEVLVHNKSALRFWEAVGFSPYSMTLKGGQARPGED